MPIGFEADSVWRARGRGFQMAAMQPEGIVIHLTGQVARDRHEQIVGKGDVEVQTRTCFQNIEALLAEVGGQLGDIISITTYFLDRAHLPVIQKVRNEFLDDKTAPVSTSIMVAGLGHEDFLIELTPIAVIPNQRFRQPDV
ncbi:MAG: RidA family protein [Geminicoccaceae bacterium]